MNYIIFDLEATCVENDRSFQNEVIEIGAVKLNEKLELIGEFDEFVKPKLNPILSDFCKNLTTINQELVDTAESFPDVLSNFKEWVMGEDGEDYVLCSWGFYDKYQLMKDAALYPDWSEYENGYSIDTEWLEKHISLKHQFAKFMNIKPCGMVKAARIANIQLIGTHHRGIDDARNIAKIFEKYFDKWDFSV